LQLGGTVALRDVARAVDGGEEDRHALQPGPLQGRQPMSDLFQAGAEPCG